MEPDANGNLWVFHRTDPAILEFDPSGKLLKSFAKGMFVQAHGLTIDRDGNIWVTDAQGKDGKGHQVFKFSPEGKVLMTLGKAGVAGNPPDALTEPNDVVTAPNGDIYVAEGHSGQNNNAAPDTAVVTVHASAMIDGQDDLFGAWSDRRQINVQIPAAAAERLPIGSIPDVSSRYHIASQLLLENGVELCGPGCLVV